jgi:hypothetical protein
MDWAEFGALLRALADRVRCNIPNHLHLAIFEGTPEVRAHCSAEIARLQPNGGFFRRKKIATKHGPETRWRVEL